MTDYLQVIILMLEDTCRKAGQSHGELAAIQGLRLDLYLCWSLQDTQASFQCLSNS